ncbi:MAG: hypothetical protein QOJ64_2168 [Acidobacteriota bacterium]|jgi:YD repeat-containing protein|nr:hypothetical protein [Acidobacteriota bacterium]
MLSTHRVASTPLFRLVSLLLCYALISPYCALAVSGKKGFMPLIPPKAPARQPNAPAETTRHQQTATRGRYRDGELLVRFRQGISDADANALLQAEGAQRAGRLRGQSGVEMLSLTAGLDPEAVATSLRENKAIAFIEPNFLITGDSITPNDPRFVEQWALSDDGAAMGMKQIWEKTTGSLQTVIAVIDSGIDFTHPDLANNVWTNRVEKLNGADDDQDNYMDDSHGWDFVTDSNVMKDEQGHGTGVAGIIAAEGNNGVGISGVMWRARLMSLRVLDGTGTGDVAHAVEAIDYAVAHGAQVINCSWGTDDASSALLEAIDRAGTHGVLVACAVGNAGRDLESAPRYPASFELPNVLAVGASDRTEQLASWSNWNIKDVTLNAPGVNILTTKAGGDYQLIDGTSASAAFVTGVAGLIKTLRPWLGAERTRQMMIDGARPVITPTGKSKSGGILSAAGALGALRTLAPGEGLGGGNEESRPNGGGHQTPSHVGNQNVGMGSVGDGNSGSGMAPRGPSMPGPNMPNLDLIRTFKHPEPKAAPPIPSTHPRRVWDKHSRSANDKQSSPMLLAGLSDPQGAVASTLSIGGEAQNFSSVTGLLQRATAISDSPFSIFSSASTKATIASAAIPFMPQAQYLSNLALNKPTTQSSTFVNVGVTFDSSRAVDGNTNGDFWGAQSCAVTNYQYQPWWQVDLGTSQAIGSIQLWPRTDCCPEQLANVHILVSDQPFNSTDLSITQGQAGVSDYYSASSVSTPTAVTINRTGRYIRVQRSDSQYLVMAEVQVWAASLTSGRLDPNNRTGEAGDDLLSRNFNWNLPLLSLHGRAGLDLGLSLNYNSLVWTKWGNSLTYDADYGTPTPGFRLGFPVIESRYSSPQLGSYAYLMITPSGQKVELRQVNGSTTYESFDSDYMQLTDYGSSLLLRLTDGTQLTFRPLMGAYSCYEIKDRNGNFITISYNSWGDIYTIKDTLSRMITFNYDGYGHLTSITQPWQYDSPAGVINTTHEWATFGYGSQYINANYAINSIGPNNMYISVLTQVGLPDGTLYLFTYNAYGQVYKISRLVYDGRVNNYVQQSYTSYDMQTSSTDCPRIMTRRDWAADWNLNPTTNVATEAVTNYQIDSSSGAHMMTAPDNTVYKEYYGTGWQSDLVQRAEWVVDGSLKKYTLSTWTQDTTAATYHVNPRPIETDIFDVENNNRRTTTYQYTSISLPSGTTCHLPSDIFEKQADALTNYRQTHVEYVNDSAYLSQRLIGLVNARYLYDGSGNVLSKSTYCYDCDASLIANTTAAPGQHDTSYNTTDLGVKRGNLMVEGHWDAKDSQNATKQLYWKAAYDTAGNVIFTRDPRNHQKSYDYSDSFSDNNNSRNAFAYPKIVTDEEGKNSTFKYNYDLGVAVHADGPIPINNPANMQGVSQTIFYDGAGRPQQIKNLYDNSITHYSYGSNYVQTFSNVKDLLTEAYSCQTFDGRGNLHGTATYHNGQTSRYRGQYFDYDKMGRLWRQSNPTEMDGNWVAAGDDQTTNWLYATQEYDWKGRPTITKNTDTTQKTNTYTGCGCAGGDISVMTDETNRKQQVTRDILGRDWKIEAFKDDGSIYSTTINNYNALDQVMSVQVYDGAAASNGSCPDNTCQQTSMDYDGYGRLNSRKLPQQTRATTYSYYPDDTLNTVTDARNVTITYDYNGRHQVKSVAYSDGSPGTTFSYDDAGNRSLMTDPMGTVTYYYNSLSRLTSETRYFNSLGQSFKLSYNYNPGGEVTSVTEPDQFGTSVSYTYDLGGVLTAINGSGSGAAATYASELEYRAWGGLKHLSYGNNLRLDLTYDSRLRTHQYDLTNASTNARVMGLTYEYDNASRLGSSTDLSNSNLNRGYGYDNVGRLQSGNTANGSLSGPYSQTYSYDVWGNLTSRTWRVFQHTPYGTFPTITSYAPTYKNNRNLSAGWQYDDDGRLLTSADSGVTYNYNYDAEGRMISSTQSQPGKTISQSYDGDGLRAKWVEDGAITYYVRSSVLGGQAITELNQSGQKRRGYVYAGEQVIAKQEGGQVLWDQRDVSGVSNRLTNGSGTVTSKIETDPLSVQVDDSANYNYNGGGNGYAYNGSGFYGSPQVPDMGCMSDGVPTSCSMVIRQINAGVAVQCPNNNCGPRAVNLPGYGNILTNPYRATADGWSGYTLAGTTYVGDGIIFSSLWTGGASEKISFSDIQYGVASDPYNWASYFITTQRSKRKRRSRPIPSQPPQNVVQYPPVTASDINIVGSSPSFDKIQGEIINDILDIANNQHCSDAFKKYGLRIPYDVVLSDKIKVAPQLLLNDSNASQMLQISPDMVKQVAYDLSDGWIYQGAAAETVTGPGHPPVLVIGRNITNAAYKGIKSVIIHEFIHAGGLSGRGGGRNGDLTFFNGYKEIQEACGGNSN